jgi:hypothetical protein
MSPALVPLYGAALDLRWSGYSLGLSNLFDDRQLPAEMTSGGYRYEKWMNWTALTSASVDGFC